MVRENQQSSAHNFVKDFSPIFLKYSRRSPLKKGAATENPLEYGKTEVQILFEPLLTAISSMELPKNFENKKLPNTFYFPLQGHKLSPLCEGADFSAPSSCSLRLMPGIE